MKEIDVLKVLSLCSDGKDVQSIQEMLSPEARKKFNQLAARILSKKGAVK